MCIDDQIPFEIPDSWEWVRLADLVEIYTGKKDANFGTINGKYDFFTCSNEPIKSDSYSYEGEYLILPGNGANIGLVIYYNGKFEAYQRTYLLENINSINLHYLKYHLEYNWKKYNADKMYGSAIPYIKLGNLQNYLVAFPPVQEQTRIVKKLEQSLPCIISYKKREEELCGLNVSFPDQLKKSILQEAVQGKLVPQDPNDEPASVLLERIRAEKERLIAEGKIKRDKHESRIFKRDNSHYELLDGVEVCIDDEIPFEIPDSWEWVRLSSVFAVLNGDRGKNYPAKSTLKSSGIPFISALNLNGKTVVNDDNLLCMTQQQYDKLGNGKLVKDDIVVCIRGSLGKHGRFPFNKGAIASSLVILRSHLRDNNILADYMMMYLDTPLFFSEIKKFDNGTAQPNLAAKSLEQFLVPIPPISEQNKILLKLQSVIQTCQIVSNI